MSVLVLNIRVNSSAGEVAFIFHDCMGKFNVLAHVAHKKYITYPDIKYQYLEEWMTFSDVRG